MNRIVLVVLCFLSSFGYAQQSVVTTEIEYSYVTMGYRSNVLNQGLDIKKGYLMKPLGQAYQMNGFSFEFNAFVREASDELCAILVIAKSQGSGKTYDLCIPMNNADLFNRYRLALDALDGNFNREYAKICSYLMAVSFETVLKAGNEEKK